MAKFVGRWLDRDGVVHADNPRRRNICCVNPWDPGANSVVYAGNEAMTAHEYGKRRNPCGRSTMAFWKYLKRSEVPTCLTCLMAVLHEVPG